MMPFAPYLYSATAIILLAEIIAGRHRGVYTRADWFTVTGCIAGSVITRPLAAILIAAVVGFLLPAHKGALASVNPALAFAAVFVLTEFAFYWGHRLAHEAKGTGNAWFWKLHRTHHSGKYMVVREKLASE